MESFKKYSSGPVGDFEFIPIKALSPDVFGGLERVSGGRASFRCGDQGSVRLRKIRKE